MTLKRILNRALSIGIALFGAFLLISACSMGTDLVFADIRPGLNDPLPINKQRATPVNPTFDWKDMSPVVVTLLVEELNVSDRTLVSFHCDLHRGARLLPR